MDYLTVTGKKICNWKENSSVLRKTTQQITARSTMLGFSPRKMESKCRETERERALKLVLSSLCISTESKIQSLWSFSCKASSLLLFLLCFFISGMGNRGQQQSVGVDFLVVRLDHRCVVSAPTGITGTRGCRGHAGLWAAVNFILPFQRCPLPVDHLGIFILLFFFLVLRLCRQKLLEHVSTRSVSGSYFRRVHLHCSVFDL